MPKAGASGVAGKLMLAVLMVGCLCAPAFGQFSLWRPGTGDWTQVGSWESGRRPVAASSAYIWNFKGEPNSVATLDDSTAIFDLNIGFGAQLLMNAGRTLTLGSPANTRAVYVNGKIVASGANPNIIDLAGGGDFYVAMKPTEAQVGELVVKGRNAKLEITGGTFKKNYDAKLSVLKGGIYTLEGTLKIDALGPIVTNQAIIVLSGKGEMDGGAGGLAGGNALRSLSLNLGRVHLSNNANLIVTGSLSNSGTIGIDRGSTLYTPFDFSGTGGFTSVNGVLTTGTASKAKFVAGSFGGAGKINSSEVFSTQLTYPGDFQPEKRKPAGAGTGSSLAQPSLQPSALTINGDFEQTSTGTLVINMTTSQYGQLIVNGNASVLGSVAVTLSDGFVPEPSGEYVILTAQKGLIGSFAQVTVSNGGSFQVNYNQNPDGSTTVTLSDYQPPAS